MNCPDCFTEVSPGSKFCGRCGARLDGPVAPSAPAQAAGAGEGKAADGFTANATPEFAVASDSAAPAAAAAPASADAFVPGVSSAYAQASSKGAHQPPQAAGASSNAAGPAQGAWFAGASAPVSGAQGQVPPQGVYPAASRGCLGEAWHDITSSPGWVKRVLLLMVMNCVPVLNFFVQGYNLQWGAQAARGDAQPLSRGTFGKKTFLAGLLFAVINLLGGIAGVVLLALNIIPFVGFVIVGIANLLISTFVSLAAMRMMVYRSFGEAFELSELCAKFKKKLGSLFAAACVPGIVVGVLLFLIMTLVMAILILASMASGSAGYYGYGYGVSSFAYDPVGFMFVFLSMFGGVMLFVFVLALFAYGFADLWSMRAVGHWVARNAPEWVEEARDSQGVLS